MIHVQLGEPFAPQSAGIALRKAATVFGASWSSKRASNVKSPARRADIGVCWNAVDLRGLRTFRYHRDHLAVVVHPGHALATRRSVSFEDTIDYEHVDIVARSIMKTRQRSAAAAAGKQMRYRIQSPPWMRPIA